MAKADILPAFVPIRLYKGDTLRLVVTVYAKSGSTRTPVDLTGYSAKMEIRKGATGALVLSLTNGSGLTLNYGGSDGQILIHDTAGALDSQTTAVYQTDLQMTDPDGVVRTYIRGTLQIIQDVTQ